MSFNSYQFLLFLPIVSILYFLLPQRLRWGLLLAASCYFYMAFIPAYILILALTIVVDYLAALGIEKTEGAQRKALLVLSIVSTCAILFVFKYYDFFSDNVTTLASAIGWNYSLPALQILLPIGLSFHTFQSLSYVIEVYMGRQKAEKHFGIYSLYVMFFPQLVAGPIERPQNLLPQFRENHKFDPQMASDGLKFILWGLFKKMVVADRLALFVNPVFDHPQAYHGVNFLIATIFFSFQIYCDFSGYSDIAIGSARILGINLMKNFNHPYSAQSVQNFWQRWHISLSTWFRDYLYRPFVKNHPSAMKRQVGRMLIFLISGLWHGANWTFVIWGALHAFYLIMGDLTAQARNQAWTLLSIDPHGTVRRVVRTLSTFALVTFAWIFFRANTMHDAFYIIGHLFDGVYAQLAFFWGHLGDLNSGQQLLTPLLVGNSKYGLLLAMTGITILLTIQSLQGQQLFPQFINRYPTTARWSFYIIASLCIMNFSVRTQIPFIYFQF